MPHPLRTSLRQGRVDPARPQLDGLPAARARAGARRSDAPAGAVEVSGDLHVEPRRGAPADAGGARRAPLPVEGPERGSATRELNAYFDDQISAAITPLVVDPSRPFPFVSNLSLSLGFRLRDPRDGEETFVRVKVPHSGRREAGGVLFTDSLRDRHLDVTGACDTLFKTPFPLWCRVSWHASAPCFSRRVWRGTP